MSDESQLQVRQKDDESSLTLSSARSGLIARGRRESEALIGAVEAESENERSGLDGILDFLDDNRSTEEILKDAEKGDAKSQHNLAVYYSLWSLTGSHGEKAANAAEAAKWYRKAADQGYAPAQFNLGWWHEVNIYHAVPGVVQDYAEAAKWYLRAAEHGYAPAEFSLGTMYDKGEGVPQDYNEAVKWYRQAANHGHASAQFNLGLKYDKGEGVPQDYSEAAKWYRRAADQRNPSAQFSLGLKFNSGQGVPRDYVQAYLWMDLAVAHVGEDDRKRCAAIREKVAAKMNHAQIAEARLLAVPWYYNLGLKYERGQGVPQNYAAAVGWYRKAAEQGHADAQWNLGAAYHFGNGVATDYSEAAKWFRKAAEQGHADAQCDLGGAYRDGRGVIQDYAEAVRWCRKAAAQGHANAQFTLGSAYAEGKGVPQDYVLAHMHYNLATSNCSGEDRERGAKARDDVAKMLTRQQIVEAQRLAREWKPGERL